MDSAISIGCMENRKKDRHVNNRSLVAPIFQVGAEKPPYSLLVSRMMRVIDIRHHMRCADFSRCVIEVAPSPKGW